MERRSYKAYLVFIALILTLLSLSKSTQQSLRSGALAATAPLWQGAFAVKRCLLHPSWMLAAFPSAKDKCHAGDPAAEERYWRLSADNVRLQGQVQLLKEQLFQEWTFQVEALQALQLKGFEKSSFYQRRYEELCRLIESESSALAAKVLFRDPSSWSSSLWINVGQADNEALGRVVVFHNSPVVVGLDVVGVIDYVGKRQSRVRLITDSGLNPAVRACRGLPQEMFLKERLDSLHHWLSLSTELTGSVTGKQEVVSQIARLKQQLTSHRSGGYWAKGELRGTSGPLWRTRGNLLQGVGFNMDFSDQESVALDLRSEEGGANQMLQPHDLLLTTGMDGVFPAGLRVAEVVEVDMLREGSYTYGLTARPTVGHLDELTLVFVLPPVGYQEEDQPPYFRPTRR